MNRREALGYFLLGAMVGVAFAFSLVTMLGAVGHASPLIMAQSAWSPPGCTGALPDKGHVQWTCPIEEN